MNARVSSDVKTYLTVYCEALVCSLLPNYHAASIICSSKIVFYGWNHWRRNRLSSGPAGASGQALAEPKDSNDMQQNLERSHLDLYLTLT